MSSHNHYVKKKDLPLPPADLRWFDVFQAAAYMSLSASAVRRLLHAGELRAASFGGEYRIDRNDCDELMVSRKAIVRPYRRGTRPHIAEMHAQNRKRVKKVAR